MKSVILPILFMLLPILASAEIVEIDGIWYDLNPEAKEAEVTKNPNYYSGDIVIPESVTYSGDEYSVTSIGGYAFIGCTGLKSITISNSVVQIGDGVFLHCLGLRSISIGNGVTSIGEAAFQDCIALSSMIVGDGNPIYDSRNNCNAIIETASNTLIAGCNNTTIPNGVIIIADDAFRACKGLESVTIPISVTTIGSNAFSSCSALTSMMVVDGNPNYDSRNNCNAIIETATNTLIAGCKNTTIPNSVASIGDAAFYSCTDLTYITIPNSITSIGYNAFYNCPNLTSLTIGNGVTSIGNSAFMDCTALTSVTIPNSVTNIGSGAFFYCRSLTTVTIPNSVTSIGGGAFSGCPRLFSIISKMENPCQIDSECFDLGVFYDSNLNVPKGTINKYKLTPFWNNFVHIEEEAPSGINMINRSEDGSSHELDRYDVRGNRLYTPQKGINIIRMSDGTTKKLMIK